MEAQACTSTYPWVKILNPKGIALLVARIQWAEAEELSAEASFARAIFSRLGLFFGVVGDPPQLLGHPLRFLQQSEREITKHTDKSKSRNPRRGVM
jgi:hypothetical protein